ncbi:uncharacterized protein EV154DRAFT_560040 [Mucor mucedo]|uniref:uncharacterized protein n=1 Tax=Mucor mucedo TaxID=29922 RepID=UPI00221E7224|nr:uncharacterized protein EV154DRAFT_560040 [Mucor mucedo]KAI7894674.1 hypothetical protein EV154DRAFT_560040 [Mucor mucedo]
MSFIFTTNSPSTPRKEKVADWAGSKRATITQNNPKQQDEWKDVYSNIKQMDQFYDATFYAWLKSEENVLVTSIYLHRIANEYPLERIVNALEWLTTDWRWESTSILVRHVTVDWCDDKGDMKRANLLRHLTSQWATHYTATLISTVLMSCPYSNCVILKRERFLREFTKNWDFSKLSEFFMFLRSRANIDYKFKCIMLQEAARRDVSIMKETIHHPTNHHRRTSSNDFQRLKEDDHLSSSSSTTTSRYHHPHHHHHHHTSASTLTMTTTTSTTTTSTSSDNLIPSPSSSSSNNDKKRITVI